MLGSILVPHNVFTANVIFLGLVRGLIVSVLAMAIVLVYRSSRVINFAVGDMGVPAAALLAIMVAKSHWPYWPALIFALLSGAALGTVVEMVVIRRLFKAPRVIVLVATIGVAEFCRFITMELPAYRTGKFQSYYPSPINGSWEVGSITVQGYQIFAIIVVPVIAFGLWWLLGHTAFGDAVRASATNADLARLTGISPKLMSTAIWTISGFLSAVAVILYATQQGSTELVAIGPETLLLGLTAALIGRMTSFPRTVLGAMFVGLVYQVLSYNFLNNPAIIQFALFLFVLGLVARMSRSDETGGESFAFAPRVPPVPERLREVWWVRNLPRIIAALALAFAIVLPFFANKAEHHQTFAIILSFAICAVSVTVLTGWAGQLSLGQMAFAGLGALTAAAFVRGITLNMGWRSHRLIRGSVRPWPLLAALLAVAIGLALLVVARRTRNRWWAGAAVVLFVGAAGLLTVVMDGRRDEFGDAIPHPIPFVFALFVGATFACLAAVLIGIGALRVKGLLLAISTMAFAIAASLYIFPRPIFVGTEGSQNAELPRGKLLFINLPYRERAYYWFVLVILVIVLLLVGHLRRTGIGRSIIGVRENESGAAAVTVSPTRSKLLAFALAGFVAGLGGALLGGSLQTFGYNSAGKFSIDDSLKIVSIAVIGGLGSLAGAVTGALWVIGLPSFWPKNPEVQLFASSIGLLIVLLYIPGGFTQIGYWLRGAFLGWVEKRLPERPVKTTVAPPVSLKRVRVDDLALNAADGSVIATRGLSVQFGGLVAVDNVDFHARRGEVIGLIGTNGAGKSTLLNAIGGYLHSTGTVELLGRDVSKLSAHKRARTGLGRTFQAATLFPELTVRETVELALEAREATPFWGSLLYWSTVKERRKRKDAAELIDFLGLGRYADRFVAELSTGTRRIVELASVLAVAPSVICLDEPTAGVAQREAEAFGPLIKRVQQELDATLIVVEHDMPLILSISDRIYCLEAGGVIAEGAPAEVRANPRVIASYLGTDERSIQRSNADATPTPAGATPETAANV